MDAALTKIMKDKKSLMHNELVDELLRKVNFPIEKPFIKHRIDSLIEKDYIKRNTSNAAQYEYIA